jgi:Spy/CpxP family protein refolding chaperone
MKRILLLCCLFIGLTAASYSQTTKKTTTDPVEKAKSLQKELKLTDEQTTKVAAVYKESSEKFDKIKVADKGNTDKMMKDIGPLRTSTINQIKAILTPAQAASYDKLIKENKGGKSNGWSDGWSATSES